MFILMQVYVSFSDEVMGIPLSFEVYDIGWCLDNYIIVFCH